MTDANITGLISITDWKDVSIYIFPIEQLCVTIISLNVLSKWRNENLRILHC